MEISIAGISIRQISITQIYIGIRLKQEGIRGGWLVTIERAASGKSLLQGSR